MDHRTVSPIEMYSVSRNQLNFYTAVVSFIRMEFISNVNPFSQWKTAFEKALRSTIDAQPRLRLQVDLQRNTPMFIILPESNFENLPIDFIERDNIDDEDEIFLNKILEKQTNHRFAYDQMSILWKLIVISSSNSQIIDLVFTFNHAIADGGSAMGFFSTFLRCLSNQTVTKYSLENDPPVHEMIPSKLPPLSTFVSTFIEKILLPNKLSRYFFPKNYWIGFKQLTTAEQESETRLISFKLSRTELDLLHKKCRQEQTTINSALLAAFLLSISDITRKETMEFCCSTAVDLRRFCNPVLSREQMGDFVSAAETYHYVPYREHSIDLFWPLSRRIKDEIALELEHLVLPRIVTLKFVSNWTKLLEDQRAVLPNGFQHSVNISNLLRWTYEGSSEWKILHGGFTQTSNLVGSPFTINTVTVNDILNVYLSFRDFQQETLVCDRMKQFLIDAIH